MENIIFEDNLEYYTEEDLDFMWEFCKLHNHSVISRLGDWRELRLDLVEQIPREYNKMIRKFFYDE